MQSLREIFWNPEERRLRALWRLIAQGIVFFIIVIPLQIIVGIVAVGVLAVRDGATPEQLSDPNLLNQLLLEDPLLFAFSTMTFLIAFVGSVWVAGRFIDRRPFAQFGFHFSRDWWVDFGFGLALGALLMAAVFLVELAFGWVSITGTFVTANPDIPFGVALLPPLATFIAVGFYEELFSRGYQLTNLAEGLNLPGFSWRGAILIAAVLSSALFGYLHLLNPNADFLSTFFIFITGIVLLGLGFLLTGELAIPIGVHITWNFFQGIVFGFPVSGGRFSSAVFISTEQGGPELWTGGAFGPEAGLIGLLAVFTGGALIALWVRWRYGRLDFFKPIAEPPPLPQSKPEEGEE